MDIDPPIPKGTQELRVNTPPGLTPLMLLDNAKNVMGGNFFNYSARDNNCQDFILAIFNGSNIGNDEDRQFIKQNTKALFGNNTFLRKVSNTITDLGGVVNTITTGAGLHRETFTKYFRNRAKKYRHLNSLEEMADYILQHPNGFSKQTKQRALFYHNIEKKSVDNNFGLGGFGPAILALTLIALTGLLLWGFARNARRSELTNFDAPETLDGNKSKPTSANYEMPERAKALFAGIDLDLSKPPVATPVAPAPIPNPLADTLRVKLNLARAYITIEDFSSAKKSLEEVLRVSNSVDPTITIEAQGLLAELSHRNA
jgi:FimV-like protein